MGEMTEVKKSKKETVKKVFEWVVDIFIILVFVVAVLVMILAINQKKTGVTGMFGKTFYTVQSDSMVGVFDPGALVIGSVYEGQKLEEDQIITFRQMVNGQQILNTHRIKAVHEMPNGQGWYYETKGDNEEGYDSGYRFAEDIVSVYETKISGVGAFIDWLKSTPGFLICVVLPILASIAYQAYKIVSVLLKAREEKLTAVAADNASDEVKEAIIKQYLESLKKDAGSAPEGAEAAENAQSEASDAAEEATAVKTDENAKN